MVLENVLQFFLGTLSGKSVALLDISIILLIVLGVSILMRILKQPLIIGYILSGILIGPLFLNVLQFNDTISIFSELGIAFLLFMVGLHLSPKVIREVGKISLITGIGQVLFTALVGYAIAIAFRFPPLTAMYIAVALTFSSTIIIMKLLADKDALEKLYGKISIGFLLVQDLIAIIILIFISSFSTGISMNNLITTLFLKGVIVVLVLGLFGYFVLPKLNEFFARSQELLFLFSITWGLSLGSLFYFLGFSIEVGALIAGVILSISPYSYEISSKLKPLRDFFIISFFLILGSQMVFQEVSKFLFPAIIFSLFILIGNPIIVMVLMGVGGYRKKTGFMAGLTVAQISEFSLILIVLGIKVGHIPQEILSFVTIIGLITIAGSTYLIMFSDQIYAMFSNQLSIFERKYNKEKEISARKYDYFLLGENRIGFSIMQTFMRMKEKYVVVDYNPERIKTLRERGVPCLYGDISDVDFLEEIYLDKAKMLVSTIPEIETNMLILKKVRHKNKKAIIIVTSRSIQETFELYNAGANYVILPHFLGGEYVAKLIRRAKNRPLEYKREKSAQIRDLKNRLGEGHEHPKTEKSK